MMTPLSFGKYNSCDECLSLWYCYFVPAGCLLNYINEKVNGEYKPTEECPKPLTKEEFKVCKKKV